MRGKKMISRKLLSKVLGYDSEFVKLRGSVLDYKYTFQNKSIKSSINIYELAHKCKEWACENECEVESFIDTFDKTAIARANFIHRFDDSKCFHADSEPEVIFKACQWILENKEK